jgi:membrane-bound lytic murein transglycosylase D
MLIRAGSTLMAPRSDRQEKDVTAHVADNAQLKLAPEVALRRIKVRAGREDTVASIAARYQVRPADVARWNAVESTAKFKPGEKVSIEVPARSGKPAGAGGTARPANSARAAKPSQAQGQAKAKNKAKSKADTKANTAPTPTAAAKNKA